MIFVIDCLRKWKRDRKRSGRNAWSRLNRWSAFSVYGQRFGKQNYIARLVGV